MKTFEIEVQEFLARVIKVKAETVDDAISIISNKYKKEEILLDNNDYIDVSFEDINSISVDDEKNTLIKDVVEYLFEKKKDIMRNLKTNHKIIFIINQLD